MLRKARFEINKNNFKIYMLLELLNQMGLNENINTIQIVDFIKENNLDIKEIIKYMDYFPSKVAKNFNRSEVLFEII